MFGITKFAKFKVREIGPVRFCFCCFLSVTFNLQTANESFSLFAFHYFDSKIAAALFTRVRENDSFLCILAASKNHTQQRIVT